MIEGSFRIDGMRCGGCVNRVSTLLKELPGVKVEDVSIGHATVKLDPAVTTHSQLVKVLSEAGYRARVE